MLLRRILSTSPRIFASSFALSIASHCLSVFDSQYHVKGLLRLRRPKAIEKLLGERSGLLTRKMEQVEQERVDLQAKEVCITSSQQYLSSSSTAADSYIRNYDELLQLFAKCPLNNEYIYKLLGWYNATPFFKSLVERLLDSSGEETACLVGALAWMQFQWKNPYGMIDEDLRERRRVDRFYKQLSNQLEIAQLKVIQRVVVAPLTTNKRKYYQHYVANHLEALLKLIQSSDDAAVNDLIWLFQQAVLSMVDHDFLISKFQKFLLTTQLHLSSQNLEKLLNLYTLKGRVDKNIYALYLKPYLLRHKMGAWTGLVESIKFVVCSECGDNALLKTLYQLVDSGFTRAEARQSRHIYDLHLYTHYLRIKGYTIKLSHSLEKELTNFCKEKSEGRNSLNRLVIDNKALSAAIKKRKPKYISECLSSNSHAVTESSPTQRSQFEAAFRNKLLQLKLDEMKIYEKPVFCCFELDFCLQRKGSDELIDVEIGGLQYVFAGSGRLVRQKEIRDQILTYYGFKVNHVDYNTFKARERISEEITLMNKRVTQQGK